MADIATTLKNLTVAELQAELKARGLKKSGNKAALIERLSEYLAANETFSPTSTQSPDDDEKPENDIRLVQDQQQDTTGDENVPIAENDLMQPIEGNDMMQPIEDNGLMQPVVENETCLPFEEVDTGTIDREVTMDSINETDEDTSVSKYIAEPIHEDQISDDNITNGRVVDVRNDLQDDMVQDTEDISNINERPDDIRLEEFHEETEQDESHQESREVEEQEEERMEEERIEEERMEEQTNEEIKQQEQEEEESPEQTHTDMPLQEDDKTTKDSSLLEKPITAVLHEEEALDYEEFEEENIQIPQDLLKPPDSIEDNEEPEETTKEDEKESEQKKEEDEEDGEIKDEEKQKTPEVKVQKPQPKPVHIRKTTVSLAAISGESAEERAARRKRRWGSTTLKDFSTPVDATSIKKLIPDLNVDAADVPDKLSYHTDENESSQEGTTPKKKGRTVKLDSAKKVVLGKKTEPEVIELDKDTEVVKKPKISIALTDDDDDDLMVTDERRKSPSPPKNDASVYLYIENLVRPFTNRQLKTLIEKSGEIVENGFWINGIKSFCYVQMGTEEEAVTTREALHGIRWPSGNPKRLKVDFAIGDKMYAQTNGELGEKPKEIVEIPDEEENSERQRKRDRKGSESGRTKKTKAEETPVKLLDDLFRKTKATPCIYWLPLSDEEIAKRQAKQKDSEKSERTRSPARRGSPDSRNRSPVRKNRSPIRRSRSPDRRRSRGWR